MGLRRGGGCDPAAGRGDFFTAAGEAMRWILIEHARARAREKRGGPDRRGLALDTGEAADLPVRECSFHGHPLQQLPSIGARQSIAFANFLSTSPLVNDSDISIEIVTHGYDNPVVDYPSRDSEMTAGDWNRIAATNNRVEVILRQAEE